MEEKISKAAVIIKKSGYTVAFTGAGISVESGIPPFRGRGGLWNKYDPRVLELDYFLENPDECWFYIREIFYDFFSEAKPNTAHQVLAEMEHRGMLKAVVTQNIDNLHIEAGSKNVFEFHGNSKNLVCLRCGKKMHIGEVDLKNLPPRCPDDGSVLKPDFIFFGEGIPPEAYENSFIAAKKCQVCLIVGSTGEVAPASFIPRTAKEYGATIIEINPEESMFTHQITDIHLKGNAGEVLGKIADILFQDRD
jgi:NAD-dependent deacetylase